jgi:hypothetical protein
MTPNASPQCLSRYTTQKILLFLNIYQPLI